MESVGQKLRDERLRQGFTLDEVGAKTRISVKNLQAIEDDEPSRISSAFFYKSFVRQFAEFLEVDYSEMSAAVQSSASVLPEPLIPGQGDAPLPRVAALRPTRITNVRWVYSLVSLFLVLAGCSTLYAVWRTSKYDFKASAMQLVNTVEAKLQANNNTSPSIPAPTSEVPVVQSMPTAIAPKVENQTDPLRDNGFKIQVSALERTWLSIVSDGKRIYSGVLLADESKVLEGHDSATIKTGNAGGVDVVFNGKEIGTLGPKGQVRTVLFTKDNFEIVPPPVRIALTTFTLSGE